MMNTSHNVMITGQLVEVEEQYEEKKRHCEQLEEELNSLKQECTKVEHNLTTEIKELQPLSEQLKVSSLWCVCVCDGDCCIRLMLKRRR